MENVLTQIARVLARVAVTEDEVAATPDRVALVQPHRADHLRAQGSGSQGARGAGAAVGARSRAFLRKREAYAARQGTDLAACPAPRPAPGKPRLALLAVETDRKKAGGWAMSHRTWLFVGWECPVRWRAGHGLWLMATAAAASKRW